VRELVRASGYESACSVKNALSSWTDSRYSIARLTVTARTSDTTVRHWLAGTDARIGQADERFATRLWRGYRWGRARLAARRTSGGRP
jgi:hypothetical protein